MVMVVSPQDLEAVKVDLNERGEVYYQIGSVEARKDQAVILEGEVFHD